MFRKELSILGVIVISVFLGVAGASWYAAHSLQEAATMIVLDTLPGMQNAGGAINRIHENWLRIHLLLLTTNSATRAGLITRIHTNTTEGLWQDYGRSVYSEEDRRGLQALSTARSAFLQARGRFLDLAATGNQAEAGVLLQKELAPLYASYDDKVQAVFAYNTRVGRERGAAVLNYARFAPYATSALAAFLFLLGTMFGWRLAWSGPDFLSRLQRRRPARDPISNASQEN